MSMFVLPTELLIQHKNKQNYRAVEKIVERLYEEMREYGLTLRAVADDTKARGMNKGKGYGYDYVRYVLVYQRYYNAEIVYLAMEMLKELVDARREEERKLQERLSEITGEAPSTEEE